MKEGRALTFAHQVTRQTDRGGRVPYESWQAFWKELEHRFLPIDEAEEAINLLETDKYYQGKITVDDYCDKFQDLVDHAGYADGRQVVMKFRKGLESEIADKVAMLHEGRPKDDDLAEWVKASKEVARQRTRNEAFNQATRKERVAAKVPTPFVPRSTPFYRVTAPMTKPTTSLFPNKLLPNRLSLAPPAPTPTPPKPATVGPIPMEVDAASNRGRIPMVCHRCGQPGHFRNQCPRRFDVRFMTVDELEDHLQTQLVQHDVAAMTTVEEEDRTGQPNEKGDDDEQQEGFQNSHE
jgi:hypothetical protein